MGVASFTFLLLFVVAHLTVPISQTRKLRFKLLLSEKKKEKGHDCSYGLRFLLQMRHLEESGVNMTGRLSRAT